MSFVKAYGLPLPQSKMEEPVPQELLHSCLKLLDASQTDQSKGAFGFAVVPSKLGFLKVRQLRHSTL